MDLNTLLAEVFLPNAYKGKRVYILCRDNAPDLLTPWEEALKRSGASVKTDKDIKGGENPERASKQMIQRAQVVIVLFDKDTIRPGVKTLFNKLFNFALEDITGLTPGSIKLIPVRTDPRARMLDIDLGWVDCWEEHASEKLKKALSIACKNK